MKNLASEQTHGQGDEQVAELPIPLIAVLSDHSVHRIEAVSAGFAKLLSSTPEQILPGYTGDPLYAVAEFDRADARKMPPEIF